ncbi:MAG: hypothetical protein GF347_00830 [Candidatus Moranbacteria bacterium]|nr:hypothetical protein [Candidatus Moranbacteria bacterium]
MGNLSDIEWFNSFVCKKQREKSAPKLDSKKNIAIADSRSGDKVAENKALFFNKGPKKSFFKKRKKVLKKKKATGILFYLISVLLISLLMVGIFYNFWRKYQYKLESFDFLAENFNDSLTNINEVSDYSYLIQINNSNAEISIKEIEQELSKLDKSIKNIEQNKKRVVNLKTEDHKVIKRDLLSFYDNSLFLLEETSKYYEYTKKIKIINLELFTQKDKLRTNYFTATDLNELSRRIEAFKGFLGSTLDEVRELNPPEELNEYHLKTINYLEKFALITEGLSRGLIQELNNSESPSYNKSIEAYNEFIADRSIQRDMDQLMKFYLKTGKEDYDILREQADNIKTKIIVKSVNLEVEQPEINIKNW